MAMESNLAWLRPRQRILQRHGHRLSIRLEEEFWEQLEFCAKDEGLKLSEMVFRLIDENTTINRSSLLRTYCARWMRKKLVQAHLSNTNADILRHEIKRVREEGFATSTGEDDPGSIGISIPLVGYTIPVALCILAPEFRIKPINVLSKMNESASRIEEKLRAVFQE